MRKIFALGMSLSARRCFLSQPAKIPSLGKQHTGMIRTPPRELLGAIMFLMQRFWAPEELLLSESIEHIRSRAGRGGVAFARPLQDHLYMGQIGHQGDQCDCKQPQSLKRGQLIHRDDRQRDIVQVFQGCIGSENTVMKNAQKRDDEAREMNILCYEMEATSVMDCVPCLPIRGIADYADAHKNNQWHLYAALSAATCARELLLSLKPDFVTRFPLNVSGDIVDRYMEGAVSNPNVFSGSEIEKLRQTRDSLMERCRFLHEVSVKELENMPNSSSTKKDKARELKKFQEILGKHLEHLNQVLENHDDLLSSSDPEVRAEYRRPRAQLREDKEAIDALARTAEGFLEEAANMLTTLAVYLDDRGVGIAGIVVMYVGRMLTRWRSSPMSPTVVFQWVCRKTWTVSSSQEEEFFIEMGHIEMGRQGPIKL
ncbi:hypothetical protein PMG11_00196 [Penicillium brasilianum]|uniref:Nucleoside phosphorylase domain-containing protein n=1 Tax=Penicillium brasilianum TaxID=104259 RepID=A0A0F7TDJ3_PENBI|nr:hypothetical protein PMG11_00196 [Penicillium brasilianum]